MTHRGCIRLQCEAYVHNKSLILNDSCWSKYDQPLSCLIYTTTMTVAYNFNVKLMCISIRWASTTLIGQDTTDHLCIRSMPRPWPTEDTYNFDSNFMCSSSKESQQLGYDRLFMCQIYAKALAHRGHIWRKDSTYMHQLRILIGHLQVRSTAKVWSTSIHMA